MSFKRKKKIEQREKERQTEGQEREEEDSRTNKKAIQPSNQMN